VTARFSSRCDSGGRFTAWEFFHVPIAATVTPSIRDVLNQYIADNPDVPSYLDLNPLMIYSDKIDNAA